MKNQKGITLIALIITIIVMLILVGVSVSTAINTGLFKTAQGVAKNTEGEKQNEVKLSEGEINIGGTDVSVNKYVATLKTISKTEDYKEYYADINDDGTVDGVIYADLAFAGRGSYYSYNAVENVELLKEYYVRQENYDGVFGPAAVLAPTGKGGTKDRFYVMALENFSDDNYSWYYSAYDNDATTVITKPEFGEGKNNTDVMITEWSKESFGAQNEHYTYKDVWGAIQTKVSEGWFLPSVGEWYAFESVYGIKQLKQSRVLLLAIFAR